MIAQEFFFYAAGSYQIEKCSGKRTSAQKTSNRPYIFVKIRDDTQ